MNIGRNVIVASKSGSVETGPTVLVATALYSILNLIAYILRSDVLNYTHSGTMLLKSNPVMTSFIHSSL